MLLTCNAERMLEIGFGPCNIRRGRHSGDFAGHTMNFGFAPCFFVCLDFRHRFANRVPGVIELTKFGKGIR